MHLLQIDLDKASDDFVENYAFCFNHVAILLLQIMGTAKKRDQNLMNQKMLLAIFESLGHFSRYQIELFNTIALYGVNFKPLFSRRG